MKETKLTTFMVNSLREQFSENELHVGKRHGNKYDGSYPDFEGSYKGLSFYVEAKMLKPDTRKTQKQRFCINKREGSSFGLTKKQRNTIDSLNKSKALVCILYYKHFGPTKGAYLIPSLYFDRIGLDNFLSMDKEKNFHFDKFLVEYKNQRYNVSKLFKDLMEAHYKLFIEGNI